ncbi:MAG: ribonuclease HI, partial [Bdellovibrionales bacterium]
GNERVDEIAVAFSKRETISLEENVHPQSYQFDILEIPVGEPLPDLKSKKPDNRTYTYLSLVNGVLTRHTDWPSCERVVKGQSQAKFKKISSEQEEKEILKKWGYSNGN